MGKGFRFQFAYTVDDLETVRDLRAGEGPGADAAGPGPGGRP
jgi:hypothetical protein